MRSDQEPNNHYGMTQSAPDAFASLVTSAELTPVRIIIGHCTPVLLVCLSTGGEDPAGRHRPGYELSRMIYGHSIWVWRQLNGVLTTEQQNSLADTRGNGYVADKLRMMMTLCVSAVFAVARCPSVCPSRCCIVSRWLKISSNFFLAPLAP